MSSTSPQQSAPAKGAFLQMRLQSLDVYRGLIMATLAFTGFGLAATAANHLREHPDSALWQAVHFHFTHVEWVGCGYWDLIQPSFMFMVGVAMAFSYGKRKALGQSWPRMFGHALWRSIVLIFLGIFLISNWSRSTNWNLMNVLTQIGLGYTFLFLLWGRSFRTQALAAAVILIGVWLAYVSYPYAGVDPVEGNPAVGISAAWAQQHLQGVAPAWHKSANVGHAIDLWLLNVPHALATEYAVFPFHLLPTPSRFKFNRGGYQTINFIPSLVTMLLGLMCGELLRSDRTDGKKMLLLLGAGAAGIAAGCVLHYSGVCPLVKRIWTPAWTLYSTGWCMVILAGLYGLVDVLQVRWWTFPLIVVGVNSIAIYCMSMLLKPWVERTWKIHLGPDVFSGLGSDNEPFVRFTLIGLSFWVACLWMYRNRIFIRI